MYVNYLPAESGGTLLAAEHEQPLLEPRYYTNHARDSLSQGSGQESYCTVYRGQFSIAFGLCGLELDLRSIIFLHKSIGQFADFAPAGQENRVNKMEFFF